MKKFLALLIQLVLISSFSFPVVACFNPLTGGDIGKPIQPDPIIKDVEYYQELIKKNEKYLADCKQWIEDIKEDWKNDEDGNMSDEKYQLELDQATVELFLYQAEINEYQYQILLLEKQEEKFTFAQILQGLAIMTKKISNLEQELELQEKYPKDYPEKTIKKTKDALKEAVEIKEFFLKLKEEEENNVAINIIANINISRCS